MFWEVVGLERGPLSLVSAVEELLEIKNSGCGLENRDYGRRDSSRWQLGTLYPQQLTLTSSTSGGRSVGILRSRTQAMEFFSFLNNNNNNINNNRVRVVNIATSKNPNIKSVQCNVPKS
jgi:hypothetical protein